MKISTVVLNKCMADNSNNGSGYVNFNICRSFNQNISTTLTMLTGAEIPAFTEEVTEDRITYAPVLTGGQPCSEVVIINKTSGNLAIHDMGYEDDLNGLVLGAGESVTLRGLTNVAQVSAKAVSTGNVYYRTQFYSINPSR